MKCEICGAENPPSMNHTSMHTCICVDCCRYKKTEWQKRAEAAEAELAKALVEIEEHHELVRMCHKRTMEADKLWQKAHNKPDVWPDLGELIQWLMKKALQVRCCRNCRQILAREIWRGRKKCRLNRKTKPDTRQTGS